MAGTLSRSATTAGAPRPAVFLAVACLLAAVPSFPVRGQTPTPQNTQVNLNYVYAASLGFGGYSLAGLTADVYTLPLSHVFGERDGVTLRTLLPIQLGLYHFKANFQGQSVSLEQQSISAVPGIEFGIPMGERLVVKPFVQAGIGHAFGSGIGNPDVYVYRTGARSVAQWRVGDYTLSLGNGVIFAGNATVGPGASENYVALQIAGEVRRPLGFKIGDFAPDLGVYLANYYYPAPLQFSRFLKTTLKIDDQAEVGFSVGSAEPFKLLWPSNPRIGAGFVFGGGLNVYRINFGFPF